MLHALLCACHLLQMVLLLVGLLPHTVLLAVVGTHHTTIVALSAVTHVHASVVHWVAALIQHVGVVGTLGALVVPEGMALHVGVHLLPSLHVHVVRRGLLLKMMLLIIMHLIFIFITIAAKLGYN